MEGEKTNLDCEGGLGASLGAVPSRLSQFWKAERRPTAAEENGLQELAAVPDSCDGGSCVFSCFRSLAN